MTVHQDPPNPPQRTMFASRREGFAPTLGASFVQNGGFRLQAPYCAQTLSFAGDSDGGGRGLES